MAWPQTGWKFKVDKLRTLLLSSVNPCAPPPLFLQWLAMSQKVNRGVSDGELAEIEGAGELAGLANVLDSEMGNAFGNFRFVWEPLSDERGDPCHVYGWDIAATMYLSNNQAWWLATASFKIEPTEGNLKSLGMVMAHFGADPERDRVTIIPGQPGAFPWQVWFTWFNQRSFTETHVHRDLKKIGPKNGFMVVPRGTPPRDGFVVMPAIDTIKTKDD